MGNKKNKLGCALVVNGFTFHLCWLWHFFEVEEFVSPIPALNKSSHFPCLRADHQICNHVQFCFCPQIQTLFQMNFDH